MLWIHSYNLAVSLVVVFVLLHLCQKLWHVLHVAVEILRHDLVSVAFRVSGQQDYIVEALRQRSAVRLLADAFAITLDGVRVWRGALIQHRELCWTHPPSLEVQRTELESALRPWLGRGIAQ